MAASAVILFFNFHLYNTNKITPEEYDMYIHEYVKKHPEIMREQSKDLQVDN